MPVRVFDPAHEDAVEVPADSVLVPFEGINVIVVGEVRGGNPGGVGGPVVFFGGRVEDVYVHVVLLFEARGGAADFEDVDFGPALGRVVVEPEGAGAGGFHGFGPDFEVAVPDFGFALDGGGGVGVVALVAGHAGGFLFAHGQAEFPVFDGDVPVPEVRGLAAQPARVVRPPLRLI